MFIVDAHLDLAFNALEFGRDLTQPVAALRRAEAGRPVGDGPITVTFPSLRDAGVGLVFGAIFVEPFDRKKPVKKLTYRNEQEAHRLAMRELDYYRRMADKLDYLELVGDRAALDAVVGESAESAERRVGIVPLLEGADPIREPAEVELWYEWGVRVIGPAWDDTRYAGGAWRSGGGFTPAGFELMERMAELGMILDVTHLSEKACFEALDRYQGAIAATHCNARALVPMERHLSDTQIRRLAERNAVIGIVLYNRFLKRGYELTDPRESVTLENVVAHIDHICQLLGNAEHLGLGSDFDGGFGAQHIPLELKSVLDVVNIAQALRERGYGEGEVSGIMGMNWLHFLRESWGDGAAG
jgi:membrane dipeptidase